MGFVRSTPTSHAPKQPPGPDSGPEGSLRDRRGENRTGEGDRRERTGEGTGKGKPAGRKFQVRKGA